MKSKIKNIICVTILCMILLVTTSCGISNVESNISGSQLNKKITAYLEQSNYSGEIMVVRDNKILYTKGFGYCDSEQEDQIYPETVMEIGSVTKQMTAAAILNLCDEGKMDLSDTLDIYFPEYQYGNQITIENLLNMTSGITDYMEDEDILDKIPYYVIMNSKWEKDNLGKYEYSNSNYYLLGKIIEQCSGMGYGQYMEEHFFEKLGLFDTSLSVCEDVEPVSKKGDVISYPIEYTYAAGGISSNMYDLYQWEKAYWNGEIIPEEYLEELKSTNSGYKYGWNCKGNAYYHEGKTLSFCSMVYYNVDTGMEVLMISNNIDVNRTKVVSDVIDISNEYLN